MKKILTLTLILLNSTLVFSQFENITDFQKKLIKEEITVSGGGHFGGGIFINSEDHARFGLLFLRDGIWGGERLLSSEWIEKIRVPSENNPSYGYMWWLNRGNRKWDGLPENIYYGSGFGGNYVIVIPDNDLVIVARWLDSSKVGELVRKVVESVN